ncbi:NAD(P)-binding protein [Aspergillus brunneoviolaceus CBS 621.78]|uniref:NAD(P)-binding protein n=1 Tax=Aspergillus brunneoviolaceus CBS 621.78 TaxID=1450534 RepID=A0ACD1G3F7_9EURO|nr:NAD(P)-binding protein [Aspergillus brunneoviolaceus CBS 621.78]RAH43797.1 NAD(P)-binding protein [Aspergillus brunneoviolaceus CBS 621.78]
MDPHSTSREKLLITGATGYIGFKTLLTALLRGYSVLALIRRDSDISDLQSKSAAITESTRSGQLKFAVVLDFLAEDAVYNVLRGSGTTVIVHLASPLALQTEDYEEDIIRPAVSMVTVFLDAARRVESVKRVVVTSSCVTLIPFEWNFNPDSERLYTATDLNPTLNITPASPMEAYWISKALARKASRDFIETHRPSFDYVNLLPGVVIGPDHRLTPSPTNRNVKSDDVLHGTRRSVLAPVLTDDLSSSFPYVGVPVHVSDVARAHIDAVDRRRIPGNREFIFVSDADAVEGVDWEEGVREVVRKYYGKELEEGLFPMEGRLGAIRWRVETEETEKVFGWRFVGFQETIKALVAQWIGLKRLERPVEAGCE